MQSEKGMPHGHSPRGRSSQTYNSWHSMISKCRKNGIYCDPSLSVFAGFLAAMGERPQGHSVERIDTTLGYVDGNVHWIKRWHDRTMTSEYFIWSNMIARCEDENCEAYHNYGGRGITIDPAMRTFNGFFAIMGPKPSAIHTLERVNNSLGYTPSNVRWATRKEQSRNQRSNRVLTANGRTQLLCEWAEELGIKAITISTRIDRRGWTVEEALTPRKFRTGIPKLTPNEVLEIYNSSGNHAEIGRRFHVSQSHVNRIKSGHVWAALTQFGLAPREPSPKALRSS